MARPTSLLQGL